MGIRRKTECRREVSVRDRPLEVGINLNTIFTALMLGVMSWVGFNIESIKDKVSDFASTIAVVQKDMESVKRDLDRHERDLYERRKK